MRPLGHREPRGVLREVNGGDLERERGAEPWWQQQRQALDRFLAYARQEREHAVAGEQRGEQRRDRRLVFGLEQFREPGRAGGFVARRGCRNRQFAKPLGTMISREWRHRGERVVTDRGELIIGQRDDVVYER